VAAAVYRALQQHEWGRLLKLSHADAVARFKQEVVELLDLAPGLGSPYAEQEQRRILKLMFGVESLWELEGTPPETLVMRHLSYTYSGPVSSWLEPRTLGHVLDGDSIAYVVVRRWPPARVAPADSVGALLWSRTNEVPMLELMTLKRDTHGPWRTMLDGGVIFSEGGFGLTLHGDDEPHRVRPR
jgi:hypothetical protein